MHRLKSDFLGVKWLTLLDVKISVIRAVAALVSEIKNNMKDTIWSWERRSTARWRFFSSFSSRSRAANAAFT